MSLAANTQSSAAAGRPRQLGSRIKRSWENSQTRLGTMVLTDVPVVLVVTVTILTLFGVMMVLSASSVEQISDGYGAFGQARSQGIFALLGLLVMALVGFVVPVSWYRRPWVITLLLLAAIALLVAVIFVGTTINGNRNWIMVGSFSMQPSEFAKPIMILWLASVYSRQGRIDVGSAAQTIYKGLMPAVLGFGLVVALILAGHDAGTVLVYGLIFAAILLAARPSRALVLLAGAVGALAALVMVVASPNRVERFLNTYAFWKDCVEATCDQANSGLAALATGGFWGVGLGQSRQKYNYLPEAHNDYIFAVVGEELGLLGAVAVLALYAALIYCAMRILLRSSDLFIRFATLGIITWIAGQALMNVGMVVGMLPVIGVPLPFISAGGSALVSSLVGIGLLIAFARQTPLTSMVGERPAAGGVRGQKDAARRLKLTRLAEQEQAVIAHDPVSAGWTLEKLLIRVQRLIDGQGSSATAGRQGAGAPGRRSRASASSSAAPVGFAPVAASPRPSASHARPSAQTVRRSATTEPVASAAESAMARRSSSARASRPSASLQQAQQLQQQKQAEPGAPARGQDAKKQDSRRQETRGQAERKLPPGLRTIKRARQLPPTDKT